MSARHARDCLRNPCAAISAPHPARRSASEPGAGTIISGAVPPRPRCQRSPCALADTSGKPGSARARRGPWPRAAASGRSFLVCLGPGHGSKALAKGTTGLFPACSSAWVVPNGKVLAPAGLVVAKIITSVIMIVLGIPWRRRGGACDISSGLRGRCCAAEAVST